MIDRRLELDRPRSLSEIISDTFAFQSPQWRTFAAAAGPAVLFTILVQLVLFWLMPDTTRLESGETLTDAEVRQYVEDFAVLGAVLVVLLPVGWVLTQLSTAGVVVVLKAIGESKPIAAGDALDAAQDRAKDLLLASLKSILILVLLCVTIIGIPFALWKAIQWIFLTQGIMVDGATHRTALKYSEQVVRGSWWLTLGRFIFLWLLVGISGSLAGEIFQAILSGVPAILLAGAVGFLTTPYTIIASSLMFYDYRNRKGLNQSPAPAAPSTPDDVAAGL